MPASLLVSQPTTVGRDFTAAFTALGLPVRKSRPVNYTQYFLQKQFSPHGKKVGWERNTLFLEKRYT